jgi:hypothetical protein
LTPSCLWWDTNDEAESDDAFAAFADKVVAEYGEAASVVDPDV